jgi:hypothetical protein
LRDRLQWLFIVVVIVIDEVIIGTLGQACKQTWFMIAEKIAVEWRRRR